MFVQVDKLDPGLSQRPSRFDRKYNFSPPGFQERLDYCQHWKYVSATARHRSILIDVQT